MVFRIEFEKENRRKLQSELHSLLKSIFRYLEKEVVLRVFMVTDETSLELCKQSVVNVLSKIVTEQLIFGREMVTIPKILFNFVDMLDIVANHTDDINEMRKYFGHTDNEGQESQHMVDKDGREYEVMFYNKYNHDLFYLAPYIMDVLPVDKVIQCDLDLIFRVSIHHLWELFDNFTSKTLGQ